VPSRLSRSRRRTAHSSAICWFKDTAHGYIDRMRRLAALLDASGVHTRMITTRRPGCIVYEDEHQVAAVPFRDAD